MTFGCVFSVSWSRVGWKEIRPSGKRTEHNKNNNKEGDGRQIHHHVLWTTITRIISYVRRRRWRRIFKLDGPSEKPLSRVERSFSHFAPLFVVPDWRWKREKKKICVGNFHGRVGFFPHVHLFVCSLLLCWPYFISRRWEREQKYLLTPNFSFLSNLYSTFQGIDNKVPRNCRLSEWRLSVK